MLIRRWLLAIGLSVATMAGPMPAGAARWAGQPEAPAAGVVGTGNSASCDEIALTNALAGGGLVTFDCGGDWTILIVNPQVITQATTIDGGGIITITGGLTTRLFQVEAGASLALEDIYLDAGAVNGSNGGAIANAGTLSLYNSTIQYSQTDIGHSGGAIYTTGPVFIRQSTLDYNTSGSAGALYASGPNARVVIELADIRFNQAVSDTLNSTAGRGGALWVGPEADVTIRDSSLLLNETEGNGGAVYNQGRLTSERNVYLGNSTTVDPNATLRGYGGAIASFGPISLTNDSLHSNSSRYGGGLFVGEAGSTTHARVSATTFTRNEAVYSGGGLYTSSDTTILTVSDSVFGGNEAAIGGGLSRSGTTLSIIRSSFGFNEAETGGGLASSPGAGPGSEVLVYDSTFYSNTVVTTQGGAIFNGALMELRNLTLEGNDSGVANSGSGEVMQISNSVLHNTGPNCDGDGTKPQSLGGNFSTDATCDFGQGGDVQGLGLDPLLGPLTETVQPVAQFFVPLPGSPLINTATAVCSPQDQRRAYRPNACDKGAIEFGGLPPGIFLPTVLFSP
jgi:predicted outer membrane repeat protein